MFAGFFELREELIIVFPVATMQPHGVAHVDLKNVRMSRNRDVDRMMICGHVG